MTTLFTFDHETGDWTGYTSGGSGNLTIANAAALHGNYGVNVNIVDATGLQAYKSITKSARIRYRFYLDPNSLTMGNNDRFGFADLIQGGGSYLQIVRTDISYTTAAGYRFLIFGKNDVSGNSLDDYATLSDAPHYIEIYAISSTGADANDGYYEWWLDGVSQGSASNVDNYNLMQDQNWRLYPVRLSGIDAGTSGIFYVDDVQANDDGSEIGAYPSVLAGIKTINGVAIVGVKTINSVAITSIKSVQGSI